MVGDSTVGKTSISRRFAKNVFNENSSTTKTVQILNKSVKIQKKRREGSRRSPQLINVGLNIWDTLGQEKFKSIAKIFFKGAAGAFVVFDVCNMESYNNLGMWINLINESCDTKIVLCIIGNKTEKFGRVIPYNQVKEFAYGLGIGYIEVSAKTGKNI